MHILKRLWLQISAVRRRQLAILLILTIFASFAEALSIGTVVPFLAVLTAPEILVNNSMFTNVSNFFGFDINDNVFQGVAIIFIISAVFSAAMRVLLLWAQNRLGFLIGSDFSSQIYMRTLYQPFSVHISRNSSEIISAISTKTSSVIYYTILPMLVILSSFFIMVAILVLLFVIDPIVAACATTFFGSIYAITLKLTQRRLINVGDNISKESIQVIKALQEGLGGIRDILIDGSQETYLGIYSRADKVLRKSQACVQIIGGSPRFIIESLSMVLIALLASFFGNNSDFVLMLPFLGAFALGAQRLLPLLQQIYGGWSSISSNHSSLKDVLELLEQPLSSNDDLKVLPIPFYSSIRLCNIGFQYNKNSPFVLQSVDLEIPKGSRIGIIGATGSGKSTLVDILMGLLLPTHGNLMVDTVLITNQNTNALRAHVAHVPQSIFLSDSSISENIAFGVPPEEINYGLVIEAAKQAQIADTIEAMEKKYDTVVGERGVRLSGGQRQRIGIARALYKQADIIVFDEATSALDNDTEKAVMEAIYKIRHDITLIMVAHRITTLHQCDTIIELELGKIKRVIKNVYNRN